MRQIHFPVWLGAAATTGNPSFVILFSLEALTRAVLVTVLPLQALALLGDAQAVSLFYFGVSFAGLLGTLALPWLVRRMRRRWVVTLSAICIAAAAPLFASGTLAGLAAGLAVHLVGAASLSICLNLYVLDHVPRKVLTRFEPLRMLFTGGAWMVGPVLGIALGGRLAPWAPYAASAAFALALLGYFWFLRMTENPVLAAATAPPPNPVRFVRRYFSQPRLSLAWLLSLGRAAWWGMFFIYTPIFAVTAGFGEEIGALMVSAGSVAMFTVTFWGWIGRRFGLRRLMVGGFIATGLITLGVGAAAGTPGLGAALIVIACFGACAVDGAGNVPFLRAVRTRERAEMTTVYASYRDTARLSMPAIFALVLQVFALPAVFVTGGLIMLGMAHFARYLPRRLGMEIRVPPAPAAPSRSR